MIEVFFSELLAGLFWVLRFFVELCRGFLRGFDVKKLEFLIVAW